MLPYLSIYIFAILEGEIYYITACVAASFGKLNWAAVIVAGALGGSTGDQLWFYILRGRLGWLDRYPWLKRHHAAVSARIAANETPMLLVSRFLPGLRVAIPVACAYARVKPIRFSALNLVSAFAWASAIMLIVARLGPRAMAALGLSGWWAPIVPAVFVLLFFRWLSRDSPPKGGKGGAFNPTRPI